MSKADQKNLGTRRDWLISRIMGMGLLLSYGLLGVIGLFFLLPTRLKPKTRLLYAGKVDQYKVGVVQSFYDLQGTPVLIRRDQSGFQAFSSVCPHLGCRILWEEENQRFFCPCHKGVFNPRGKALSGPPADGGQNMRPVPLKIDVSSGVIYIEVKNTKKRNL